VRPGIYVENINYSGKAIHLKSEKGARVTTIDGGNPSNPDFGSCVIIEFNEGPDSILEGFTLINGTGRFSYSYYSYGGGGVFIKASPTIIQNIIIQNTANRGGGISVIAGSPLIANNVIAFNEARPQGFGWGGGVCCNSITACPKIVGNIIADNSARLGGGLFLDFSTITSPPLIEVTGNDIINNLADDGSGQGIGGGIFCGKATVTAMNNILWNNNCTSSEGPEIYVGYDPAYGPTDLTIDFSDLKGGQTSVYVESGGILNWGAGMIDAAPLFADSANGDFHLTWNSPCRDTGDNSVVTRPTDFEGDPRIALGTVDMGADEYYYHLYHMGNVMPGSPIDIKVVGYPTAPITLYLGSGLADPPYSTQHGDFWLNWPPLWLGNIGTVPGDGVLSFLVHVPTSWTPGSEHPLQALVGPWNGPWTRLTNAEVLVVE